MTASWPEGVDDEFDELVATIADEVLPSGGLLSSTAMRDLARNVVNFIVLDDEMRPLMRRIIEATDSDTQSGKQSGPLAAASALASDDHRTVES
jgi:hypothetical protein